MKHNKYISRISIGVFFLLSVALLTTALLIPVEKSLFASEKTTAEAPQLIDQATFAASLTTVVDPFMYVAELIPLSPQGGLQFIDMDSAGLVDIIKVKTQGGDPRSDPRHIEVWRNNGDVTFTMIYNCFVQGGQYSGNCSN